MNKTITLVTFGLLGLAGCNSDSARNVGGGDRLAAAGIAGSVAATAVEEQDSTPMVVRRVWGGRDTDISGGPSPDGRYLCYVDWGTGNVALRDLSTGESRQLTDDGSMDPYASALSCHFSPDGSRVAYKRWVQGSPHPVELKIVDADGSEPRLLYTAPEWFSSTWAPDGEHLLLGIRLNSDDADVHFTLLSVADGSTRDLDGLGADWPTQSGGVSFAPDGRYVVYDVPMRGKELKDRDIYTRSLDGGDETALVQHPADDFVLGWAPDGRYLLFASDRTGNVGAWLLPVVDGKPAGEARMVKPDLWRVWPMGFTQSGSFFYGVNLESHDVLVATIDPETGEILAAPTEVNPSHVGFAGSPSWSPDGSMLAYLSSRGPRNYSAYGQDCLAIRSIETGETREVVPELRSFGSGIWWVDDRSLLVQGRDSTNRWGLFLVDHQTGATEALPAFWGVDVRALIAPSPDGKKVFYTKWVDGEGRLAVMDLETGEETVLFDEEPEYGYALSPDGQSLAFAVQNGTTHRLLVVPARGGEPRELFRFEASASQGIRGMAWPSRGKHLLYVLDVGEAQELWRIPVAGGEPEKLDLSMGEIRKLQVHPDGRRIAFETASYGAEVWVMENFLPASAPGTNDSE